MKTDKKKESLAHGAYATKEEVLTDRYLKDCRAIEDKQDDINTQKRIFQELDEAMLGTTVRMHELMESYANSNNKETYHFIVASQNELFFSHASASQSITELQDELSFEKRKLEDEREDMDKKYKKELQDLRDTQNDRNE